jgi:hypothetical protein
MGASLNPGLSGLFCFGRNSQEGKVSANWGGGLGSPRILQVLHVLARSGNEQMVRREWLNKLGSIELSWKGR